MLLFDTNIVSYIMRGHPLREYYVHLYEKFDTAISFMTVAELYEGAFRASWGPRRMSFLEDEISSYIIYDSSPEITRLWAEIRTARKQQPISVQDAWIAATALAHSCPLVTHDAQDFYGISNLKIITSP